MQEKGIEVGDQTRTFGVLVLLSEIALCCLYGFYGSYQSTSQMSDTDDMLVIGLLMLCVVGFCLLFSYIKTASYLTILHILFMFAFSMQLFFMYRGMWDIVGISQNTQPATFGGKVLPISLTNNTNDRQVNNLIRQSSFADFLPCFLSLVIAYGSLVGRIGHLEVFFLTAFGTIIYEFNSQLFWRFYITDCGFSMRTFLYGGSLGFLTGLFLWKRTSTISHPRYSSDQSFQKFALIGYVIVWSFFPFLSLPNLYHQSSIGTDNYILEVVPLNVWLALSSSVIGSCCACLFIYDKLSVKQIAFASLSGAIAYNSSADLIFNPAYPIAIGSLTSFISSFLYWVLPKRINKKGVLDSLGCLTAYVFPGIVAGVISAIVHGVGASSNGKYLPNAFTQNNPTSAQLALFQMAGVGLSISLGGGVALLLGFFFVFCNFRERYEQFTWTQHIRIKQEEANESSKQQ